MEPLKTLKNLKHQAFILREHGVPYIKNELYSKWPKIKPYYYDKSRYQMQIGEVTIPSSSTFLVNNLLFETPEIPPAEKAPQRIFAIWFGNEMNENRKKGLETIKKANPNLDFILVTEENLADWTTSAHPLHPAFKNLSAVHKSDYLRTYLMHHYGGVYTDIKALTVHWEPLISELNSDSNLYAVGPAETTFQNVSKSPGNGKLGSDQERYFQQTLYPACYACKPNSPFTQAHLDEIERRLSYFEKLLEKNPAEQPWGLNSNYPIAWNALHGQIFSPLNLKYHKNIKAIPGMVNNFGAHR
ncbi:capsular polysaccharide synthesis protein [Rothia aerolata]|uniref:Mannosyltransferase OCH1 and related enzymes n=1 Tax=Rothia aerolata TaxID=1812262 RepID=A0A917MT14_9MICC|nr:capsular polysaccharide synthesis protein [Rothia aerolata]GGH62565.1 hypothetical protein GCM10007359_12920 [Rothia aerolata]